jgi:hypothetical protein
LEIIANVAPFNSPKGENGILKIKKCVENFFEFVVKPTKHNQLPPWGIEGASITPTPPATISAFSFARNPVNATNNIVDMQSIKFSLFLC